MLYGMCWRYGKGKHTVYCTVRLRYDMVCVDGMVREKHSVLYGTFAV